ncbi:hypothetical protein K439DRAFT_1623102 [Ramaria rubella]|nr:hypothetical protein K439DRAFT_1623102 [Ramaria rubella]
MLDQVAEFGQAIWISVILKVLSYPIILGAFNMHEDTGKRTIFAMPCVGDMPVSRIVVASSRSWEMVRGVGTGRDEENLSLRVERVAFSWATMYMCYLRASGSSTSPKHLLQSYPSIMSSRTSERFVNLPPQSPHNTRINVLPFSTFRSFRWCFCRAIEIHTKASLHA